MNYLMLSKEISYALRHAPWEYELELDKYGWVPIEQLLDSLKRSNDEWLNIKKNDLHAMIATFDTKRHEISDDKIRALYGHSTQQKVIKESMKPPVFLYHGTAKNLIETILQKGLLPMGRQYVHLSTDVETAFRVGVRKDSNPFILQILAQEAWNEDIKFYCDRFKVWLADAVPSKYISKNTNIGTDKY